MAGSWLNTFAALLEHKLAKGSDINDRVDNLGSNFDKLPLPRDDGKLGFDGACSVGTATDDTHAVPVSQMRTGFEYGIDSGAANAYVVTLVPAATAYTDGMKVSFIATNENTGASTVNVNGLGAVDIKIDAARNLYSGYIITGDIVELTYNGTNFQITNLATQVVQDAADAAVQAAIDTGADLILTNADVVLTHADVLLTNADVVSTNADVNLAKSYSSGEAPLGEPATGSAEYWANQSALNSNQINNNLLVDPNFQINNGYVNGTNVSIGEYAHSLWKALQTGDSVDVTGEVVEIDPFNVGTGFEQKNDDILAYPDGTQITVSLTWVSGSFQIYGCGASGAFSSSSDVSYTFTLNKSDQSGFFQLRGNSGTPFSFKHLKFEASLFATKYEIPLKTEEESKFKRYYRRLSRSSGTLGNTGINIQVLTTSSINCAFDNGVPFSSTPAITASDMDVYAAGSVSYASPATANTIGLNGDNSTVSFTLAGFSTGASLSDTTPSTLRHTATDDYIEFDARY